MILIIGKIEIKSAQDAGVFNLYAYQLMRMEMLNKELFRKNADQLLFDICVADGMSRVRAKLAYYAVRLLGDSFADSKSRKEVLVAPE